MEDILQMKNICKSFNTVKVLKDVQFSVKRGECHAICGENGAGKSTLMKILCGVHEKDSGEITFKGQSLENMNTRQTQEIGISMIYQELNLIEDLTVAQNIFLQREPKTKFGLIDEKKMSEMALEAMKKLEPINPNAKIKNLSIAEKQIVEVAKAISFNSDLIIMDEPTAVLTNKETDMLYDLIRTLKKQGVAVVYISHRLREIKEICDRITILRDGEYISTCNVADVSEHDIAKMMVGRDIQETVASDGPSDDAPIALEMKNITVDNVLDNVSLSLKKGEILGISGLVGAGRTELAEVLFGIRHMNSGEIYINGQKVKINSPSDALKHKLAFATEDRKKSALVLMRSIRENMILEKHLISKGLLADKKGEKQATIDIGKSVNLKYSSTELPASKLSGGNQQKIVFGKWILSDADIYIFDEPTRGVDVGARKEIYTLLEELAKQGKAVIVISSDIPEILALSNRILVMHQGSVSGILKSSEATEEKIMMLATGIIQGAV